jgi:hypothetical protein
MELGTLFAEISRLRTEICPALAEEEYFEATTVEQMRSV